MEYIGQPVVVSEDNEGQCQVDVRHFGLLRPVRPYLAKFRNIGKIFKSWAIFIGLIYYLAKKLACFGKFCIPLGQILIDVNCQMLKNNLAIWYTGTGQTFFVCFLTSNNCHILQTYRKHFQCNKLFMTLRTFIIFVITKDKARLLLDGIKNKTENL